MIHGDDKGLVIPPNAAENKVVIVPILFDKTKSKILKKANEISKTLQELNPILDDRTENTPGNKFNEWELKGIPIRIEIGPKDLEKNQVVIVRRDNGEKKQIKEKQLKKEISKILEEIQSSLFKKAKKFLNNNIDSASSLKELNEKLSENKIVKVHMIDNPKIEAALKEKTGGANSRIIEEGKSGKCIQSGKKTNTIAYISKSYWSLDITANAIQANKIGTSLKTISMAPIFNKIIDAITIAETIEEKYNLFPVTSNNPKIISKPENNCNNNKESMGTIEIQVGKNPIQFCGAINAAIAA